MPLICHRYNKDIDFLNPRIYHVESGTVRAIGLIMFTASMLFAQCFTKILFSLLDKMWTRIGGTMLNQHSLRTLRGSGGIIHQYLHSRHLPGRANWGTGSQMAASEPGVFRQRIHTCILARFTNASTWSTTWGSQRTAQISMKGVNLSKSQTLDIVEGQRKHGTWFQTRGVNYTLGFEEII